MSALLLALVLTATPAIHEGDILFQTSKSAQSAAIQLATHSKFSHTGVVVEVNGKLMVFEAIQPVKYTPLEKWIARGDGGAVAIKRLRDPSVLTKDKLRRFQVISKNWVGKDYDLTFSWSDDRMYCSELVWKPYRRW